MSIPKQGQRLRILNGKCNRSIGCLIIRPHIDATLQFEMMKAVS